GDRGGPSRVGLLLETGRGLVRAERGGAWGGAGVGGLTPTGRGEPLARDIGHADCQIVLTEERFASQLADALATPAAPAPVVLIVETSLRDALASQPTSDPPVPVGPDDLPLLIFTPGTTGG